MQRRARRIGQRIPGFIGGHQRDGLGGIRRDVDCLVECHRREIGVGQLLDPVQRMLQLWRLKRGVPHARHILDHRLIAMGDIAVEIIVIDAHIVPVIGAFNKGETDIGFGVRVGGRPIKPKSGKPIRGDDGLVVIRAAALNGAPGQVGEIVGRISSRARPARMSGQINTGGINLVVFFYQIGPGQKQRSPNPNVNRIAGSLRRDEDDITGIKGGKPFGQRRATVTAPDHGDHPVCLVRIKVVRQINIEGRLRLIKTGDKLVRPRRQFIRTIHKLGGARRNRRRCTGSSPDIARHHCRHCLRSCHGTEEYGNRKPHGQINALGYLMFHRTRFHSLSLRLVTTNHLLRVHCEAKPEEAPGFHPQGSADARGSMVFDVRTANAVHWEEHDVRLFRACLGNGCGARQRGADCKKGRFGHILAEMNGAGVAMESLSIRYTPLPSPVNVNVCFLAKPTVKACINLKNPESQTVHLDRRGRLLGEQSRE